jgi:hypothetical protein
MLPHFRPDFSTWKGPPWPADRLVLLAELGRPGSSEATQPWCASPTHPPKCDNLSLFAFVFLVTAEVPGPAQHL